MCRKQRTRCTDGNVVAARRQRHRHRHEHAVITNVEELLPVAAPARLASTSFGNTPRSSRSREWTDIDPAGFGRTKRDPLSIPRKLSKVGCEMCRDCQARL